MHDLDHRDSTMTTARGLLFVALGALILIGLLVFFWPRAPKPVLHSRSGMPEPCRDVEFEGVHHVVCTVDLESYAVALHHDGADGKPFGSVAKFDAAMAAAGKPVLLAMNAGMYHQDLSPVGLYVEDGKQLSPLEQGSGKGNFFMKPNGVFLIGRNGEAAIMTTEAYAAAPPDPLYATQSGPLLVIDGRVNPRFEENGTSRYIRNGIGVIDPHTLVLAISRAPVSFGSFARLFRDRLGCGNALYFDGQVSVLSNGSQTIVGGNYPAGPILSVSAKEKP
jgi:uncharacterized protein YigE (DUF2233 family)